MTIKMFDCLRTSLSQISWPELSVSPYAVPQAVSRWDRAFGVEFLVVAMETIDMMSQRFRLQHRR